MVPGYSCSRPSSVPPWHPGAVPCDVPPSTTQHPKNDDCKFGLRPARCRGSSTRCQAPHSLRGEGAVAIIMRDADITNRYYEISATVHYNMNFVSIMIWSWTSYPLYDHCKLRCYGVSYALFELPHCPHLCLKLPHYCPTCFNYLPVWRIYVDQCQTSWAPVTNENMIRLCIFAPWEPKS